MARSTIPVLVGVGQVTERPGDPDYEGLLPQDLAARAARAALADASERLAAEIDTLAAIRLYGDSVPDVLRPFLAPLGTPDNFPRAVAARLGIDPPHAIYSRACGDEPQRLLGELGDRIAAGESRAALLVGGEAILTQRLASQQDPAPDWSEAVGGTVEDRGLGIDGLLSQHLAHNGLGLPATVYPLFEHARRSSLGASREDYARAMGELFQRFNRVAAENPLSMSPRGLTAEQIISPGEGNRLVADPYLKHLVARDAVNQGSALLLTSEALARELGVPEEKWVYLHGRASVTERIIEDRADLGASPAMAAAYRGALEAAGVSSGDIAHFDLYSCFPIAVFCALDALGMDADDPRPLTVTGGLPYFGGPGNNYSTHAIASMAEALREYPGEFGLVGANGGMLSKHSVGVYSTRPVDRWQPLDCAKAQAAIDALPAPGFIQAPEGIGVIESYTVIPGQPTATAIVLARLQQTGARFCAASEPGAGTGEQMLAEDPLGAEIVVTPGERGNRFRLASG